MRVLKKLDGFEIPDLNMKIIKTPEGYKIEGGKIGARAYSSIGISLLPDTWTLINLNIESYDLGGNFDNTPGNYKFTAPVNGYYQINASARFYPKYGSASVRYGLKILKNDSDLSISLQANTVKTWFHIKIVDIVYLTAGDYLQLKGWHTETQTREVSAGSENTFMSIFLIMPD